MSGAPARAQVSPGARDVLLGLAAGLAVAGLWIVLTAATEKTYHLAPVIAAAAPALVVGGLSDRVLTRRGTEVLIAVGLGAVATGWLLIEAFGIVPTTTVLADQPGGVRGEVVSGALLGAAGTALYLARRRAGRTDADAVPGSDG